MRKTFGSHKQWRQEECKFSGLGDRANKPGSRHSPVKKLTYLVVALLMLMIGLAGILIPVIPGLLFLAAALFYFGKLSPGVKSWSDNHPILGKVNERIDRMGDLRFIDRIKISALMSIEAISTAISVGLDAGLQQVRKWKTR